VDACTFGGNFRFVVRCGRDVLFTDLNRVVEDGSSGPFEAFTDCLLYLPGTACETHFVDDGGSSVERCFRGGAAWQDIGTSTSSAAVRVGNVDHLGNELLNEVLFADTAGYQILRNDTSEVCFVAAVLSSAG